MNIFVVGKKYYQTINYKRFYLSGYRLILINVVNLIFDLCSYVLFFSMKNIFFC